MKHLSELTPAPDDNVVPEPSDRELIESTQGLTEDARHWSKQTLDEVREIHDELAEVARQVNLIFSVCGAIVVILVAAYGAMRAYEAYELFFPSDKEATCAQD